MVLTPGFKTSAGFLYDIEYSEDGLEAVPCMNGQSREAGYSYSIVIAMEEWKLAVFKLGTEP